MFTIYKHLGKFLFHSITFFLQFTGGIDPAPTQIDISAENVRFGLLGSNSLSCDRIVREADKKVLIIGWPLSEGGGRD